MRYTFEDYEKTISYILLLLSTEGVSKEMLPIAENWLRWRKYKFLIGFSLSYNARLEFKNRLEKHQNDAFDKGFDKGLEQAGYDNYK
jgi:hypothetical protein